MYWNSRNDREHQSNSIYTDVICLAEELRAMFGATLEDDGQSPKHIERSVEQAKQGLGIDVSELPLSRWQEWRISRKESSSIMSPRRSILQTILPSTKRRNIGLAHKLHPLGPHGSAQSARSDATDGPLNLGVNLSSSTGYAGMRSSHDENTSIHTSADTPAEAIISEEEELIVNETYEVTEQRAKDSFVKQM